VFLFPYASFLSHASNLWSTRSQGVFPLGMVGSLIKVVHLVLVKSTLSDVPVDISMDVSIESVTTRPGKYRTTA
jgi:hypothetical protein